MPSGGPHGQCLTTPGIRACAAISELISPLCGITAPYSEKQSTAVTTPEYPAADSLNFSTS